MIHSPRRVLSRGRKVTLTRLSLNVRYKVILHGSSSSVHEGGSQRPDSVGVPLHVTSFHWKDDVGERGRIEAAKSSALPASALSKACQYALTLWTKLTRFLEYPELELSNNLAENSTRPVALGRKNWIHIGSPHAGPKVAAILSVVESCQRLRISVRDYLGAVLPGLGDVAIRQVPALTPLLGPLLLESVPRATRGLRLFCPFSPNEQPALRGGEGFFVVGTLLSTAAVEAAARDASRIGRPSSTMKLGLMPVCWQRSISRRQTVRTTISRS